MRAERILLCLATIAGVGAGPVSAIAQQALPPGLVAGEMAVAYQSAGSGWCSVAQGTSLIQRNGANTTALITFPQLTYFDGTSFFQRDGQARLSFTAADSGTVKFKLWGPNTTATFAGYSQTYNGQMYIVAFSLTLQNNCTLPISTGYEVAP